MHPISLTINATPLSVPPGTSVAAALMLHAPNGFRRSVSGELRTPLCGMGVCFECRATINGISQQKTCQIMCAEGMEVRTDE